MDLPAALQRERPVSVVPRPVIALLIAAFLTQVWWHGSRPPSMTEIEQLPAPPPGQALSLASFGDRVAFSRAMMLWLQAFDQQPGISVPLRLMDYERLVSWLQRIIELDPRAQYPLLSAARVYSEVPDDARRRRMLRFIHEKFVEDPGRRWPWMAHAVYVAKHRMKDLDLALYFASQLRTHTDPESAPSWARQMELFVLEDMGDVEGAKVLLGGLIESGAVSDPNEVQFLKQRFGIEEKDRL